MAVKRAGEKSSPKSAPSWEVDAQSGTKRIGSSPDAVARVAPPRWDDGDETAERRVVRSAGRVCGLAAPLPLPFGMQPDPVIREAGELDVSRPSSPFSEVEMPRVPGASQLETLTIVRGGPLGRMVPLVGQTTLGRSPKADVQLLDHGVSRRHACIRRVGGRWVLRDLKSRNGTFVDGMPAREVALVHGNVIRVGPTATLHFCSMDEHQRALLEKLREARVRDPLTAAFNRSHFAQCLQAAVAWAAQSGGELSALILHVDGFGEIADRHGLAEGDLVLSSVAGVCENNLRGDEIFARYGAKEFAVALPGVSLPQATETGERLRIAVSASVGVGSPRRAVTVSIGGASLACVQRATAAAVMEVARRRLAEATRSGCNRVIASG